MIYTNGRQYEGSWLKDLRSGKGWERYPNKNVYNGDFHNGKAHG